MKTLIAVTLVGIFIILAMIHFYWASGGQWGIQSALPTSGTGEKILNPSTLSTIIVGFGLLAMGMVYIVHIGWIQNDLIGKLSRIGLWVIPVIFMIRAIGDFKYVGFFKSIKGTDFAHWDTILFSPLCLAISVLGLVLLRMK